MKPPALAVCFLLLYASVAFADCDRPGTPNPVKAYVLGKDTIELDITNTAREGSSHDIWFLIQDGQGVVTRFTPGHINYGQGTVYLFTKLTANQKYCYEVWTRDDSPDGCRSEKPSGWVCGTTSPPYQTSPEANGLGSTGGHGVGGPGSGPPKVTTPPTTTPPATVGTVGQTCMPDNQAGPHCLETGSKPSICNFNTCIACVSHLNSCTPGAVFPCCQAAQGDGCVIDNSTGKGVCNLVDGSLPGQHKNPPHTVSLDITDWKPNFSTAPER